MEKANRRIFIYGMGHEGIRTYLILKDRGFDIKNFIDSSVSKQKRKFDGINCISLNKYMSMRNCNDEIIVAINNKSVYEDVRKKVNNTIYYRDLLESNSEEREPIRDIGKLHELYKLVIKGIHK